VNPTLSAAALGGFTLGHALWSVSDLPADELLMPLLITEDASGRRLQRFEAETQDSAVTAGKLAADSAREAGHAYAFAHEGVIREAGEPVDVILVEFWAPGAPATYSVVQRMQRMTATMAFRATSLSLAADGRSVAGQLAQELADGLGVGIESHPEAAKRWDDWHL